MLFFHPNHHMHLHHRSIKVWIIWNSHLSSIKPVSKSTSDILFSLRFKKLTLQWEVESINNQSLRGSVLKNLNYFFFFLLSFVFLLYKKKFKSNIFNNNIEIKKLKIKKIGGEKQKIEGRKKNKKNFMSRNLLIIFFSYFLTTLSSKLADKWPGILTSHGPQSLRQFNNKKD